MSGHSRAYGIIAVYLQCEIYITAAVRSGDVITVQLIVLFAAVKAVLEDL